ncbi:MAG: hypothetical protein RBU29_16125 [bacterium]|jgi:hypothetical protein|nr:hypothetical protein [bacterium]
MINRVRKQIGEITDAYWDETRKAVRFTITFADWGVKLQGTCSSGIDPTTKAYVSPTELKTKVKKFIGMKVFDETGEYSTKAKPDYERLKRIRFHISLSSMNVSVSQGTPKRSVNSFLRHL